MSKAVFLLLVFFGVKYYAKTLESPLRKEDTSIDKTISRLQEYKIRFPKVVLAQMILETGTFKSKIFKENHNPFGMKHNKRGFSTGVKNGHANYPHMSHKGYCTWECYDFAFMDYRNWQDKYLPDSVTTEEQYLYYLDHLPGGLRYAEDPLYTIKLRNILNVING